MKLRALAFAGYGRTTAPRIYDRFRAPPRTPKLQMPNASIDNNLTEYRRIDYNIGYNTM